MFEVIGKTTDGKWVVKGVFKLFDTTGIPLFMLFDLCEQSNYLPSWIEFYNDAVNGQWKHKTIINRLEEAITDVYGKEYADVVVGRLNKMFL